MIVVSNTSPVTSLAAIQRLDLLQALYTTITIPGAVYQEIAGAGLSVPGTTEVQSAEWIQTRQSTDTVLIRLLQQELDEGESEAIALAVELNADLLLLDERRGRVVAARFNLKVTGVLGVLLAAKARGILPAVRPVMDELLVTGGFWIGPRVYGEILQLAGE